MVWGRQRELRKSWTCCLFLKYWFWSLERLLSSKYKYSRFRRLEKECGMTPERELRPRSSRLREKRAPMVGGIAPFSLLWLRSRPMRAERAPISAGMVPVRPCSSHCNPVTLPPSTVTPNHSETSSLGSSLILHPLSTAMYFLLKISSSPPMSNQHLKIVALSCSNVAFAAISGAGFRTVIILNFDSSCHGTGLTSIWPEVAPAGAWADVLSPCAEAKLDMQRVVDEDYLAMPFVSVYSATLTG
mmetsp:Transcript_12447/g.25451  ORF Transcript_12447/g.25451 Transcript_12447/m.25451 type:complete len:244 (-) Transcript_12447:108-839(-)